MLVTNESLYTNYDATIRLDNNMNLVFTNYVFNYTNQYSEEETKKLYLAMKEYYESE